MPITPPKTKTPSMFKVHHKKVVRLSIWITLIITGFSILGYALSADYSNSNHILEMQNKLSETQKSFDEYQELKKIENDIISQSKKLDKHKLLIDGFNEENIKTLLDYFPKNFEQEIKITIQSDDCKTKFQNLFTNNMKCYNIALTAENIDNEAINNRFYQYIKNVLPGYIIPLEISATKLVAINSITYNLNSKYYFVYFSKS